MLFVLKNEGLRDAGTEGLMGNLKAALEQADKIIAQDKDSQYRPAAVLDSMFILIQNGVWEQALKRGDLFIEDYPQHDNVTEAYRLRALCKYNLNRFFFF